MSKAQLTRQKIVSHTAVLFNQKGFAGTSMEDITAATGLSKGGLYGHFPNKEAIAVAAFEHAVQQIRLKASAYTRPHEHPADKLLGVIEFYRQHILSPPIAGGCPILNTATESDDTHQALRACAINALAAWQARITQLLTAGQEQGLIKPEIQAVDFAICFIALLEGGIMFAQLHKSSYHFEAVAAQLSQMAESLRA